MVETIITFVLKILSPIVDLIFGAVKKAKHMKASYLEFVEKAQQDAEISADLQDEEFRNIEDLKDYLSKKK